MRKLKRKSSSRVNAIEIWSNSPSDHRKSTKDSPTKLFKSRTL